MLDCNDTFLRIDFMSEALSFENNGSKNFKSKFGAFISLIIIITVIIISSLFGREIFSKEIPLSSTYNNFVPNSEFNLLEFPIFFELSDVYGTIIQNWNDYFYISADVMNYTNSNAFYYGEIYKSKNCELNDFKQILNHKNIFSEIEILMKNPLICLSFDENSIVKNDYSFTNSSFINFNFDYRDPKKNDTVPSDYLKRKDDFYVKTYFINNYVNPFDFENPVKFYIDSRLQQISSGFLRRSFFKFTKNMFISDEGWLLENKKTIEYISYNEVTNQIDSKSLEFPYAYYWITLTSPQVNKVTYRSYIKIQELAAKIGGIINALFILFYLVFSNYLRYSYLMSVGKSVISGEKHKQNIKFSLVNLLEMGKFEMNNKIDKINEDNNANNCISKQDNIKKDKNDDQISNDINNDEIKKYDLNIKKEINRQFHNNSNDFEINDPNVSRSKMIESNNFSTKSNKLKFLESNFLFKKNDNNDYKKDEDVDEKDNKNEGKNINKKLEIKQNFMQIQEKNKKEENDLNDKNLNLNNLRQMENLNQIIKKEDEELKKNQESSNTLTNSLFLNELDKYIDEFYYLEYIFENLKSIFTCCNKNRNIQALNLYISTHIDFFYIIRKLTILSVFSNEEE